MHVLHSCHHAVKFPVFASSIVSSGEFTVRVTTRDDSITTKLSSVYRWQHDWIILKKLQSWVHHCQGLGEPYMGLGMTIESLNRPTQRAVMSLPASWISRVDPGTTLQHQQQRDHATITPPAPLPRHQCGNAEGDHHHRCKKLQISSTWVIVLIIPPQYTYDEATKPQLVAAASLLHRTATSIEHSKLLDHLLHLLRSPTTFL